MSVHLEAVRCRAGKFTLEITAKLSAKVTGIFGPSGAGKTTLLETIAGLRRPESGVLRQNETLMCDVEKRHWIPPEKREVGYVPQDLALFPHKTVLENLQYGSRSDAAALNGIIAALKLGELLERYQTNLSGGEQQRVAIGRALIPKPRLLMLDEPLSQLDEELKERGLELFRQIRDEFATPILYVSHSAKEMVEFCEEVFVLKNGTLIAQGSPRDLFRRADRPSYSYSGA